MMMERIEQILLSIDESLSVQNAILEKMGEICSMLVRICEMQDKVKKK